MPRILLSVASSNVPQQVATTPTLFRTATFFGYSGFNANGTPKNNAATVYIGINSGECAMPAAAGGTFAYNIQTTPERDKLGNYWYQGTAGDGLYIIYN